LILDALNRARRETDPVPGLQTDHGPGRVPAPWSRLLRTLPWTGLVIALAVIAWLLLREGDPAPDGVAGVDELSRNVSRALDSVKHELQMGASAPRGEPRAGEPRAAGGERTAGGEASAAVGLGEGTSVQASSRAAEHAAGTSAPATPGSTPGPRARQASPVERFRAPGAAPGVAGGERIDEAVLALYRERQQVAAEPRAEDAAQEPETVSPAIREEQRVDIEALLLRARHEAENAALADHPAPFLMELSQQTRDQIPTILYQRHDYAGSTDRSSVVMNGEVLRAGGSPAAGLRIDEILPDSTVLSYRDNRFRLRALNSWVNL